MAVAAKQPNSARITTTTRSAPAPKAGGVRESFIRKLASLGASTRVIEVAKKSRTSAG